MEKFESIEKLEKGIVEYLHIEDLSSLECLAIMTAAKRRGLLVERIGCWTSRDKCYFTIHDYDRFCPDYLQDIEGWEFKAYEQIRITYEKIILKTDPTNLPLFELSRNLMGLFQTTFHFGHSVYDIASMMLSLS